MLILASASPRRHEILTAAGIDHIVRPAGIPEELRVGESPSDFVLRLAETKARAVSGGIDEIVLGADTIVTLDDHILGKPSSDEDAARMLRILSGRQHFVYTAICLSSYKRVISDVARTKVNFVTLTEDEIQEYTRSGESRDKAGAYAIQGLASKFVQSIDGCYHNVVGLPVSLVYSHLKAL